MARRILGKTQPSMKFLIWGKEGTRKSNTAIQIAKLKNNQGKPLKVLLLDLEYKAIEGYNESWLEASGVDFGNVCEIRTRSIDSIYGLVDKFVKGHPIPVLNDDGKLTTTPELDAEGNPFVADVLIFDSISVLNDLFVSGRGVIVEKRTKIKIAKDGLTGDAKELAFENAGMQFLDYAKLKEKALKMVRDLNAVTGKHVFYISRGKDAKKSELVNGKMESIDLGYEIMDATSFKFLPYEVSVVLHTEKTPNNSQIFTVDKDSTGVYEQGTVLTNFDISVFDNYMNNKSKTELLKTTTYEEDVKKASAFTEESDDNDIKFKVYTDIIETCKSDAKKGALVKQFCIDKKISLGNVDLISLSDLTEIKKIIA